MRWPFRQYDSEAWAFLKKHHPPTMTRAFGIAEKGFWQYEIGDREVLMIPVIDWCREEFGPPGVLWSYSCPWVLFANDVQALHFKLRWC